MTATRHTLKNGFTLLLEESHAAPVVSFSVLVKVGSAMETESEAGISHFIEHMLFKGTTNRGVGQTARTVEASGGDINAYTSFDQTVYYINMASRYADTGMEILADMVQNPLFDDSEIERESEVICEEIRRGNDNPSHVLSEHLFAHTYGEHPYGRPIIGYAKTVKGFRRDDFVSYWQRWYTPGNMTMIVVGDFDTATYVTKLDALFGGMPARPTPQPADVVQVANAASPALRCFQHRTNIQSNYFGLSFLIPPVIHDDVPALDILSHILGGGESARLEMEIKERRRLVQSIYAYSYTPRGAGIFLVGGMAKTAQMLRALTAIRESIEQIRTTPPHAAEVARAKLNIISSELYERESVGGQGGKYAYMLATAGDHQFEERYYAAIQKTSAEAVRAVAEKYLAPAHGAVTWLGPTQEKLPAPAQAVRAYMPTTRAPAATRQTKLAPAQFTMPGGVRVIVRTERRLPLISCFATVLGGTRFETARNNGINALLSAVLTKSTQHRDTTAVAEAIDAMAGDFSASTGYNTFGLRAEFLSEKMNEGFELLGEMITAPAFDRSEVAKEKSQLIEAIRNREDNLPALALMHFCRTLFGNHPYALPRIGHAHTIRPLSVAALQRYYRMIMHPKNMVLSIAGDIDAATVRTQLDKHLVWRDARRVAPPRLKQLAPVVPATVSSRRADKEQAHIFYGMRATTVTSPDRYTFAVLNQVLAGQGGRLFLSLRDQQSLAYSVSASHQLGIEPGFFTVYIGTDPKKVDTAIDGIKQQLRALASEEVRDDELARARQYLVGGYELELQRNSAVATNYALNVLYGLGLAETHKYPERILRVTARDILRVAKQYLREDRAVCSIVRP